jgi:hypothetical protein
VPNTVTPDDIRGRRIDLLGRKQFVPLGSAYFDDQTAIFTTGNIDFRSGGGRIYVAFVTVEYDTGAAFDAGVKINLGSLGTTDWLGALLDLSGQVTPFICYANMGLSGVQFLPIYANAVPFGVTNKSTGASSQFGTFSAYGWAEN